MTGTGLLTVLPRASEPFGTLSPVPFGPALRRAGEPGYRGLVATWLCVCLFIVPSGALTRLFEWTGIPIRLGGAEVYLTVYLPLVLCLPMVLWLGYWWGAVPAYCSTFLVAWMGGMPLSWIFLFALANPIGLAAVYLGYRSFPFRTDLRSVQAFLYYTLVLFVASMAGSSGSLVWAHTNQVGLNQFYPVWQGWWLGGFVQGMVLGAPLLFLLTPAIERWKTWLAVKTLAFRDWNRRLLLVGAGFMLATIVAYVLVVRRFMYSALDDILASTPEATALRGELNNVLAGLALPQWILITLVAVTLIFGFRVGFLWSAQYRELARELEESNRQLQEVAITDSLTGAFNHKHLIEALPGAVSAGMRHDEPLSCAVLDIDLFKRINDRLGHLRGDSVLRQVVQIIISRLRRDDSVFRFGGDEFVLLMRHTDTQGALQVSEDIRRLIADTDVGDESTSARITVSIGVAELSDIKESEDPARELLSLADKALYRAKEAGRNRTVAASRRDGVRSAG